MATHDLYAACLSRLRNGTALWVPEPPEVGYAEVSIGDVGYLKDGAFVRLFNALAEGDDSCNTAVGVPRDFMPLRLPPPANQAVQRVSKFYDPGQVLKSQNVVQISIEADVSAGPAGLGTTFKCSRNKGALLLFKRQAIREDTLYEALFSAYMVENYRSWLSFANDRCCRNLNTSDLIFVTGTDKTAEWASAVFEYGRTEASIKFSGILPTAPVAASVVVSGSWENAVSAVSRTSSPGEKTNQTVFVRGCKVKERMLVAPKIIRAASEPSSPGPRDGESDTSSLAEGASLFEDWDVTDSVSEVSDLEDVIIEEDPHRVPPFHPSDAILDYILKNSDVAVAVVNDSAWCQGTPITDLPHLSSQEVSDIVEHYTDHFYDVYYPDIADENEEEQEDLSSEVSDASSDAEPNKPGLECDPTKEYYVPLGQGPEVSMTSSSFQPSYLHLLPACPPPSKNSAINVVETTENPSPLTRWLIPRPPSNVDPNKSWKPPPRPTEYKDYHCNLRSSQNHAWQKEEEERKWDMASNPLRDIYGARVRAWRMQLPCEYLQRRLVYSKRPLAMMLCFTVVLISSAFMFGCSKYPLPISWAVLAAGGLFTISYTCLLTSVLSLKRSTSTYSNTIDIYIIFLFFSDITQAIGGLLELSWVTHGYQYYPAAQGVIQQIGDIGAAMAYWSMTIQILYIYWRPQTLRWHSVASIVSFLILESGALSIISANSWYRTSSSTWCWIDASQPHFVGEYAWLWCTLAVAFAIHAACFLGFQFDSRGQSLKAIIGYPLIYAIATLPLYMIRMYRRVLLHHSLGSRIQTMSPSWTHPSLIALLALFLAVLVSRCTSPQRHSSQLRVEMNDAEVEFVDSIPVAPDDLPCVPSGTDYSW